jgi:beta-glucosidase/6-phospho-beta-glucosidase/beta-galactosidase
MTQDPTEHTLAATDFQWMTGFECTAFPQVGTDELEQTEHLRWWASDLLRVRETGVRVIRYGIPWHIVNPAPHVYDWSWTDQALDLMDTLGLVPIVDLFHFGTPLWIEDGILNPIFAEMQSWYAAAFARRYPHLLYYTPTNEPYIEASFGAEWAIWYPFRRGQRNAARAFVNVAGGLSRSMIEIRRVQPAALMMIADTCEYYHSLDGAFQEEADFRTERRFLVHDMYQGLLDRQHPMWDYLVRNGVEEWELDWFLQNPVRLDILGLDYYRHSEHQLRRGPNGERIDESPIEDESRLLGWAELTRQYSSRYNGVPVILAETNMEGEEARIRWVEYIVEQTRVARGNGVPVCGFTYYGAIDHVDWDTALRMRNNNINPCGMWSLHREGDRLVRRPTALVDLYRRFTSTPLEQVVGPIASAEAAERARAVWQAAAPKESVAYGV